MKILQAFSRNIVVMTQNIYTYSIIVMAWYLTLLSCSFRNIVAICWEHYRNNVEHLNSFLRDFFQICFQISISIVKKNIQQLIFESKHCWNLYTSIFWVDRWINNQIVVETPIFEHIFMYSVYLNILHIISKNITWKGQDMTQIS